MKKESIFNTICDIVKKIFVTILALLAVCIIICMITGGMNPGAGIVYLIMTLIMLGFIAFDVADIEMI